MLALARYWLILKGIVSTAPVVTALTMQQWILFSESVSLWQNVLTRPSIPFSSSFHQIIPSSKASNPPPPFSVFSLMCGLCLAFSTPYSPMIFFIWSSPMLRRIIHCVVLIQLCIHSQRGLNLLHTHFISPPYSLFCVLTWKIGGKRTSSDLCADLWLQTRSADSCECRDSEDGQTAQASCEAIRPIHPLSLQGSSGHPRDLLSVFHFNHYWIIVGLH